MIQCIYFCFKSQVWRYDWRNAKFSYFELVLSLLLNSPWFHIVKLIFDGMGKNAQSKSELILNLPTLFSVYHWSTEKTLIIKLKSIIHWNECAPWIRPWRKVVKRMLRIRMEWPLNLVRMVLFLIKYCLDYHKATSHQFGEQRIAHLLLYR
jgi:hypothetical protein